MSTATLTDLLALPGIRAYLDRVEARLGDDVAWVGGSTAATAADTLTAGGKRLRPLLVLLSAPASGHGGDDLVRAGSAVELVHMATLVHDDVLDRASLRRGRPTVWAQHGEQVAGATGDFLFARAFAVLAETGDMESLALLAQAALGLSEGEALQMQQTRDPETTPERYFERCTLKTGRLFAAACGLGGRLGGLATADAEALAEYGRLLGIAFQVADDILDCGGSAEATGKALGTDLIGGTATLPLLYAARVDTGVADALRVQPPADEVLPLLQRVAATGALDEARETARELVRSAEEALDRIQGDLDTAPLRMVVRGVVDRDT
ncbi:MAG: polyprenyl synthetase family protein [Gaiellales bacterium]